MSTEVGVFLGQTLTVAGVAAGVTQFLKVAEGVHPLLAKIPGVGAALAWFVDTITPEDPGAIQIFVGVVCFALNVGITYYRDGSAGMDILVLGQALVSFLQASGGYVVLLKPFQPAKA